MFMYHVYVKVVLQVETFLFNIVLILGWFWAIYAY